MTKYNKAPLLLTYTCTILITLLNGCSYNYYPVGYYQTTTPQIDTTDQIQQTSHSLAQVSEGVADLLSSAYPMFYSISYMTNH